MSKKSLSRKKINPYKFIFTGEKYLDKIKMQQFSYNAKEVIENKELTEKKFSGFPESGFCNWLNIHGIHDIEKIQSLANKINLHNLAIQDILDVNQRPKFQDYEKYWFFSTKTASLTSKNEIEFEQLSFILGENYLVSFQEKVGDHFDHIRNRIREKIGLVRERGCDFLFFLLLEALLDNYFKVLDAIEQKLEGYVILDDNTDPSPLMIKEFEHYKRQVYSIKKIIVPTKEFVNKIEREDEGFISPIHMKYYVELKDICLTLIDDCDKMEQRLDSNINLFFSVQGHRMNQVMKTLTIVATIFIPLTFIAGVYGMNFKNMPELDWEWGYYGIWGIMFIMLIAMFIYFRRKGWF